MNLARTVLTCDCCLHRSTPFSQRGSGQARAKALRAQLSKQEPEFESSRDLNKASAKHTAAQSYPEVSLFAQTRSLQVLLGGAVENLKSQWFNFVEQASSPRSMISGVTAATAFALLALLLPGYFPDMLSEVHNLSGSRCHKVDILCPMTRFGPVLFWN